VVALTIGMATYDDFDGVYFTLQALRLYQDLSDTEIVVIDNYGCETTRDFVENWTDARYIRSTEVVGTAAGRDRLFREAQGEAVLCCDSHVLFVYGAIARLKRYYRDHPGTNDLLQGPLLYDDAQNVATHFHPQWRDQMWGTWETDPRGLDPDGEPFEIPMQGLGVFSARKDAWPGFNPAFRGFGGEEGYIHEKFRQAGARCLCLPWLRWMHRFGRPKGVPYPLSVEDKFRNYLIGHAELGLDLAPIVEHFSAYLSDDRLRAVIADAERARTPKPRSAQRYKTAEPLTYSPLVSAICLTYNRAPDNLHLLDEAVESFLRQDYPNKELIVFNDTPGQELVCNAPGVIVINAPERLPTLGEKFNAAIAHAHGMLLAPWDDDDINLPWRLSTSVAMLGAGDYYNAGDYWFLDGSGLHHDHALGVGHFTSLISRRAYDSVGGYPAVSLGVDYEMDQLLRATQPNVVSRETGYRPLTIDEWFYLYRWGVSPVHLSANGDPTLWDRIGARPITPGRFTIEPRWYADYVAMTREAIARVRGQAVAR
jgi:glycosyltransferase involved in cell wall biosynthesis